MSGDASSNVLSFFPRYLDKGSTDGGFRGGPIYFLQRFLIAAGYGDGVEPDGDYGDATAAGVARLQEAAGAANDGHFGQEARSRVFAKFGIDFDAIPAFDWRPGDGSAYFDGEKLQVIANGAWVVIDPPTLDAPVTGHVPNG